MKKKKILLYSMTMIRCGTERTIANLANHFINEYDVTIVSNINHPSGYELDKRIKLLFIDKKDKLNESIPKKIITKISNYRTRKLKEIVNIEKPNLIITFLPEPTIRILRIKNKINTPVLVAIRNSPKNEFYTPIQRLIRNHYYKKADKIILQDESYFNDIPKSLNEKYIIIPNYITNNFINTKLSKNKKNKIVTVARLEKQKNILLLIDSFKNISDRFNNYKLYIYGNGSLKEKLEKQIIKSNLKKRVILYGTSHNIADDIKDAKLFVLSSNYEGMPNALIEAMALGLPVISTNSSEIIPNLIENDKNGIIIPKKNKSELTNKIEYVLDNPKKAKQLGNEASNIKSKYKYENIIKKWENLIINNIN